MDWALFYVYGLTIIIGLCLYLIAGILGLMLILFLNKDIEKGKGYLRNITIGIFGGIIAIILYDLKGDDYKNLLFYIIDTPLSLIIIFIFVLIGFGYLYGIDKICDILEKIKKGEQKPKGIIYKFWLILKKKNKPKVENKKISLEDFLKDNPYALILLSIFLLVTIELVGKEGYLNNILALLSALITYSALISINMKDEWKRETFSLGGFRIVFPIFISTFCAWAILNVVITLTGEIAKAVWGIVWLILMIYPSFRFWFKKRN